MKYFLLSVILTFSLVGCKKKELKFVIQGNLTDATFQQSFSNVEVKLYKKLLSSGSEEFVTSTTTDGAGFYVLDFNRDQAEYYRLIATKNNYFPIDEQINFNTLSTEDNNIRDFNTTAMSWVKIIFQNEIPVNSGDMLKYTKQQGKAGCATCCPITEQTILNQPYFETVCVNDGNTSYSYLFTTNGDGPSTGINSIVTTPFDTVVIYKGY